MNAAAWAALGAALLLVPQPRVEPRRLAALVRAGRLPAPPVVTARWRLVNTSSRIGRVRAGLVVAPAGLLVVAVWLAGGLALGIAVGAVAMAGASVLRAIQRRRRSAARRAAALAAVRQLITELEAGARPPDAFAAAAAVTAMHRAVLADAAGVAADGGDVAAVLLADTDPDLVALGHAWRVAQATGAPTADVLRRLGVDLAADQAQVRAADTALAGPRASAALLAGLPVIGILLGGALGARPLAFLLGSANGHLVCCAGTLLDAAGVLWTLRLVHAAEAG